LPASPLLFSGTAFPVDPVTIGTIVLSGLLVLLLLRLAIARMDMRHPQGLQVLVEWALEFTRGIAKNTMPNEDGRDLALPLAFFTILFLLVANLLGLILTVDVRLGHPLPALGLSAAALRQGDWAVAVFDSPTANLSCALGLAIFVWLLSNMHGLRHPRQWLRHFYSPNPLGVLEFLTNPITHGMRLYGNIFAGEVLLAILINAPLLFHVIPWTLPLIVVWTLYAAFVAVVQAYVFTVLLCLYIGNMSFEPPGGT